MSHPKLAAPPEGVTYAAKSRCRSCGRQVRHKPYGGPQRRHLCGLRWLSRLRWSAYQRGWDDGHEFGIQNPPAVEKGTDLAAVWARWDKALQAKPSKGPIRDHTPIIDSACDVPDLAREVAALRARVSQNLDEEFAANV